MDQRMLATLAEKARRYTQAKAGEGPFLSFYGPAPQSPGRQQTPQSPDHEIRRFGTVVASFVSGFRPVAATVLIRTEKSTAPPQPAALDATT
jgi:hypothetical protein